MAAQEELAGKRGSRSIAFLLAQRANWSGMKKARQVRR
jgi:hypothetical protein